eukprot:270126-Ditylum_brightwellii.AAC.1
MEPNCAPHHRQNLANRLGYLVVGPRKAPMTLFRVMCPCGLDSTQGWTQLQSESILTKSRKRVSMVLSIWAN